jgi:uncharacterized protein (DUF697 family)
MDNSIGGKLVSALNIRLKGFLARLLLFNIAKTKHMIVIEIIGATIILTYGWFVVNKYLIAKDNGF